jgi:uncharacterized protein YndB with AHSA1/START domain
LREEAIRKGDVPGVQLRRRREVTLPIEEAWEWLAQPARLRRWLADEAALEEGGVLSLARARAGSERGRTLEIAAPRLWSLSFEAIEAGWGAPTRLTFRLHRALDGTEVDVFHEGFHRLPPALCLPVWEAYRRRWEEALERLAGAVAEPG